MRTGVALHKLREEVLIEAGFSTKTGHSAFSEERLNQLIARHERAMATEDDWPGLDFEETVTVGENTRYVDLPENISFTDISAAYIQYGGDWVPILHGITAADRSVYDDSQRATPIQKWQVRAPGDDDFEVWPIGSTAQTILFEGQKKLGEFEDDNCTCTLDADVLVLRVAAVILGRDKKEDAALKIKEAGALTSRILKKQGSLKSGEVQLGRRPRQQLRPGIDFIAPGSGS